MRADHFLVRPFLFADYRRKPAVGYGLISGRVLRLGGVDLDAAFELRAVLDANPRRGDVAYDGTIAFDVDAVAGVKIANHLAVHDHLARVNLGGELRRGPHGELMTAQGNGSIDLPVDLQIFGAGDLTFDLQAGTKARGAPRRATAQRRSRWRVEGYDRGFYCWGWCRWFSLGLLFGPHSFLP